MSKFRRVIGSVVKSKETGKSDYIKINQDITLKKGQTLSLQSAKSQLESLQAAVKAGKLQADYAEELIAKVERIPEFVRFEIVSLEDKIEKA